MFVKNGCKNWQVLRMIPLGRFASPWLLPSCRQSTCCPSGSSGKKGGSSRQIRYRPYVPPAIEEHDLKNILLKRPMSPGLDVYAPTLPSLTSIFQRVTGVILTLYALMLSGGALFLPNGIDTYVCLIQSLKLGHFSVLFIKGALGLPFAFHYFNGIRFVLWNLGRCLSLREVYSTARLSWVATVALTIFFCLM